MLHSDGIDRLVRAAPTCRSLGAGTDGALLLVWLRLWLAILVVVVAYCGNLAWFVFYGSELADGGTGQSAWTFTDLAWPAAAFLVLVWLAGMPLAWASALEVVAATSAPAVRPRAAAGQRRGARRRIVLRRS